MKDEHDQLEQGEYFHKCDSDTGAQPIKIRINDEPGEELLLVARTSVCDHGIWSFSHALATTHRMVTPAAEQEKKKSRADLKSWPGKALVQFMRSCSSHANYHWHLLEYLKPLAKPQVRAVRKLDTIEDVKHAHMRSMATIDTQGLARRKAWSRSRH